MGATFSVDEIFEMAEQIERNGARFYRKSVNATSNKEVKHLFELLADMEVVHEKTFADMRAEFARIEHTPEVVDPNGQGVMYLRAMADGKVFDIDADPSEQLTGRESLQDVLNFAIGLEKDTIVFCLGLEECVPAESGKEKVRDIIKQEIGHINLLNEKLNALGK